MTDKLDEYTDVLNRLASETVACTPQEWTKGVLSIECDGVRINYKLKNEDEPGKAVISEELRDLIDEFYVRMSRRDEAWLEAHVQFDRSGDQVKFETSFKYPAQSTALSSQPSKPWWKMW